MTEAGIKGMKNMYTICVQLGFVSAYLLQGSLENKSSGAGFTAIKGLVISVMLFEMLRTKDEYVLSEYFLY